MGVARKIRKTIKSRGFGGFCKYALQYYLGIVKLQRETTALYHFLDEMVDIREFPRTKNKDLRVLQDCDTLLLGIFDKVCKKHNLTYWIEYGTLLGAVRHGGFVPWDDDTDIAMPRTDYEKAYDLLHDELAKYDITLQYYQNELCCLTLHYRHQETGIWADILPMDSFVSHLGFDETCSFLASKISKYTRFYDSHINSSKEIIWNKKKELIFDHQGGNNRYMFHGMEFREAKIRVFRESDLIPCSRVNFNGVELNAPADSDAYLSYVYTKNYMSFPHGGVLHHGDLQGRPPLDQWAKLHHVDMYEVKKYLEKVLEEI